MGFLSLLDLNVLKNWLSLERISLCSSGPSPSPLSLCQEDEFVFWCVFLLPPPFHVLLKWALSWFSITSWFRIIKDNDKEQMALFHPEAHYWIDGCKSTQVTSPSIAPGDATDTPHSWGPPWGLPSLWLSWLPWLSSGLPVSLNPFMLTAHLTHVLGFIFQGPGLIVSFPSAYGLWFFCKLF